MADIIDFPGKTVLETDPDTVLEEAKGCLSEVIVIGVRLDEAAIDEDLYVASSTSNLSELVFLHRRLGLLLDAFIEGRVVVE